MTNQATRSTIAAMSLSISLLAVRFGSVFAQETPPAQAPAAPMMQGGKGGMMPGQPGGMGRMMSPEMMQQRQAMMMQRQEMMQQHWTKMEGHLANIEALLRDYLVTQTDYESLERALEAAGLPLADSRWARFKSRWYQNLDLTGRENAGARPSACCNKPPTRS